MKFPCCYRLIGSVFFLSALAGCSDNGKQDLQQWMAEQRAQIKPQIPPISEPKKFKPQAYTEVSSLEPFSAQKLTQALRRDTNQTINATLLVPELARRKEPLESFPLDIMAMVGTLNRGNQPVALIRIEKLLYQVRLGNYLGLNYGRITRITETELALREIFQDAGGEWIERVATLQLQEKLK